MGNYNSSNKPNIKVIASKEAWIESKAIEQLEHVASLEGIKLAVGFPDLHPGKGIPIGVAFVSKDLIYPMLIGNDIGCAMSFWQTDLNIKKVKLERYAKKLKDLEHPWNGDEQYSDRDAWREEHELESGLHNLALGTIGGGNHFAELQKVDQIFDHARFQQIGLSKEYCSLLVHSGSRSLGQSIFQDVIERHGSKPLLHESDEAELYLNKHNEAMKWSAANRALIAYRFSKQIGAACKQINDVPHNMITKERWEGEDAWFHRKGAASSRSETLMIPGSRGTLSYLVAPTKDHNQTAWSLAHGAGRRWQRGYAKPRLSHKYKVKDMERNKYGGRIICEDRELIYEEAPQAYKDIEQVISDLKNAGLINIIATYKPLLTYKHRRTL